MKNIFYKTYLFIKPLFNKYIIAIAVFIVAMLTSENHSIVQQFEYNKKIRQLEREIEYYKAEIARNKERLEQLNSDKDDLERFARERYWMHRPDEDVFVVE